MTFSVNGDSTKGPNQAKTSTTTTTTPTNNKTKKSTTTKAQLSSPSTQSLFHPPPTSSFLGGREGKGGREGVLINELSFLSIVFYFILFCLVLFF